MCWGTCPPLPPPLLPPLSPLFPSLPTAAVGTMAFALPDTVRGASAGPCSADCPALPHQEEPGLSPLAAGLWHSHLFRIWEAWLPAVFATISHESILVKGVATGPSPQRVTLLPRPPACGMGTGFSLFP